MAKTMSVGLWALLSIGMIAALLVPVGIEAHFVESCTILGLLVLIKMVDRGCRLRNIYFALATALIIQYVFWRVTSTLPSAGDPVNFVPAIIVLAAELFCIVMLAGSIFVISDPITRAPPPKVNETNAPTVDVFVPSYNEDLDIIAVTLAAATAMRYPSDKLKVHLLDDGGTDEKCASEDEFVAARAKARRSTLQKLCQDFGVHYLTRERNLRAKAGNLNNALRHTTGELVVIFDADHAPSSDFLQSTVGYFLRDDHLFLVQTPHHFVNPDPLERNLQTFANMPSENEMFYTNVQRGLDKWNASFFCGSAAVLRRTALDDASGFSGSTITEDAETALELHAKGWNSVYIDKPLIAGLQPETFESFIGQRSRWCRGMIQILLMKNPLFKKGLSLAQRICYMASVLFWLFPLPRLVFLVAPLFFVFFNLKIYVATEQEFIAYTMTYITAAVLLQNYIHRDVRWPWISELYEYIQSVYLFRAVISVFLNPRSPKFNVTQKGVTLEEDQLSSLAWPYYLIFAVLLAAMVVVFRRYQAEPGSRELLVVIGLWNAFNLVTAGIALGVVSERRERRKTQRVLTGRKGVLTTGDATVDVRIVDVSFGGIKVRPAAGGVPFPKVRPGELASLSLRRTGGDEEILVPVTFANGRSDAGGRAQGLRFIGSDLSQYRMIADLMFSNLAGIKRSRLERRRSPAVLGGSLRFAGWSVSQSWRGITFVLFKRLRPGKSARPIESESLSPAE